MYVGASLWILAMWTLDPLTPTTLLEPIPPPHSSKAALLRGCLDMLLLPGSFSDRGFRARNRVAPYSQLPIAMHAARAVLFSFLCLVFSPRSATGELRDVCEPLLLSRERACGRAQT